jgi:hypothetical protein
MSGGGLHDYFVWLLFMVEAYAYPPICSASRSSAGAHGRAPNRLICAAGGIPVITSRGVQIG